MDSEDEEAVIFWIERAFVALWRKLRFYKFKILKFSSQGNQYGNRNIFPFQTVFGGKFIV